MSKPIKPAEKGVAESAPADAEKAELGAEGASPLLLAGLALLLLAVLLGAYLFWRRRRRQRLKAQQGQQAGPAAPALPAPTPEQQQRQQSLPKLFAAELARLRKNATGRDFLYRIPWCMVVGRTGAGQSTIVQSSGLHAPFSSEDQALADAAGCHFHFFDQGIVLDVDGGTFTDEPTLGVLLGELRRARPRRPVDSLLLVIAASELYGPGRLDEAAARQRGEALYQKVQLLQRRLGLRVPVYVLISKCDLVPGFIAYSNALSSSHRAQLLGWSNPQELDKPYQPEMVGEAFARLYQAECQLQFDLLAAGRLSESERDAVFLLPRNLSELGAPLRLILDQVFRATVYSETTVLRGIYFCGDTTVPAAFSGEAAAIRRPAFVNHLFSKKIFPEFGLSRPLASGALSGANLITLVKVATVLTGLVCALVLSATAARLERDTQSVMNFLEKIPRKNSIQESGLQERERYARQSERLLNAMSQVPARSLRSIALPTSWLSSIDDDVRELILQAFESVILSGLRSGLEYKATQLFGLDPAVITTKDPSYEPPPEGEVDPRTARPVQRERPTAPPKVLAFASMPEYQELHLLGTNYTEFGQYVELYNRLGSDRRKHMDTVGPLVKYVFRIELGEDFNKNRSFYEEALENATHRPFELKPVTGKVRERARQVAWGLGQRLFEENPIDLGLEASLRYVNRLRTENDSGTPDLLVLTKLRDTLAQIDQDLGRSEIGWLFRDKLDLGEPYRDLQGTLRTVGGASLTEAVTEEWQASFARLRRRLFEHQAPGLGALLARDTEKGSLVLAPGSSAVRAALDGFLGQSFVQQGGERQPMTTPDGAYRVSWSEEVLRQTVQLSDAYTAFLRDRLPPIYPDIREVVRGTALERLGNSMPILVSQARRVERITRPASDVQALQDILSGEVAELKRVGGLLRQILDLYERTALKSQHSELYRQLQDDTREILRRLDLILDKDDPYRVSAKLAQWRGQRPPSFDAFDVDDAEGLTQYLKAQRTRIRNLARDYAKTPVSMLDGIAAPGGGASTDPLFNKWRNIVGEVEHFEAMTPGNSVKEIESFVETSLASITPENCQERMPKRSGDSRDFFLQSRSRVYDAVRKRCSQFVEERLMESYDRLAQRFNKTLAGHFPFSKNPSSLDEEEANPRDVRLFFADYDQFLPRYDAFIGREDAGQAGLTSSLRALSGFMEAMRTIRPFFAPLLNEKSTDSTPKYNLAVEYRVNRSAEINGNQIAEWSLAVSDQRIDDTQTAWQLGEKLRLAMRWAKDGPYHPAANDQVKGASVDGTDTINFEWGGYWAILRFLRIHRSLPSDLRKAVDRQPHILKFVVDIVERKRTGRLRLLPDAAYNRKDAAPTTSAKSAFIFNRAVVYVRFALSVGEGKDVIVVPAEWPAQAPLSKEQTF